jgi:flagellar motor switch protein FliN
MGDGSLSQDEIDALLQGADDISASPGPTSGGDFGGFGGGGNAFSPAQQNSIKDTIASVLTNVVPSLSGYLGGKNLSISNPLIEVKQDSDIRNEFPGKYIQVSIDFNGNLNGKNLIIFNHEDAGSLSALMMGEEKGVASAELTDAHLSTLQEFTNQFLSSLATQLGNKVGGGINTTPATVTQVNVPDDLQLPMGEVIKITYDFSIEGIISSKLYHIMDVNLASGITNSGGGGQAQQSQQQFQQAPQTQTGINPVKFPPLGEGMLTGMSTEMSLLHDVPMTMTVELGRTTKLVKDILGLGEGSIIELDKLAGEPVDLLVNGKLIAKGEVVVIDENFGVRVTDIVSPDERLHNLHVD